MNSDTSLTLAEPWTGTSIVNGAYRARQLGDVSRYPTQAATIIELLGNGVLSSLAELGAQAGKLPIGNSAGGYDLIDQSEIGGTPDPNGSVKKLADIELGNYQILQTDGDGNLKAITLAANKALVTDANKDVQQINLDTLGRVLLALATGTNAEYVQADGTLQPKSSLPISTATQTALDAKASLSGATFSGDVIASSPTAWVTSEKPRFNTSSGYNDGGFIASSVLGADRVQGIYFVREHVGGKAEEIHAVNNGSQAGYFFYDSLGNFSMSGSISKGGGTFLIDHPLDPENKDLAHGFAEAPENLNIYRGDVRLVDGRATVDIDAQFGMSPGTFAALNADVTVSALQNLDGFARVRPAASAASGVLEIICEDENSSDLISWMVTGRRKDAYVLHLDENCERGTGRFIAEREKEDA